MWLTAQICIFYLVLRALDTIEDDMTIEAEVKVPLLVDFYKKLDEPGWTFDGSGPKEKDRQLLVEFDKVIAEYQLLNEGCRDVIADVCARMGAGMASYIELSTGKTGLSMQTWGEYELYCHFVAGLVGEGLSGLFSETKIESPGIRKQLTLSNHMGLFLQKTNIIRDYAEDCEDGRFFWPKECWNTNDVFQRQAEVQLGVEPVRLGSDWYRFSDDAKGREAQAVLSSMLLDVFSHAIYTLEYLVLLRDQSVFNFCAIPQVMAIATLDLMVNNADVFKKNIKIRKSLAVQLILRAVNPKDVAATFQSFAKSIHKKISPADPNYVRWCVELGRIETWAENKFPSFVAVLPNERSADVRALMFESWVMDRERIVRDARRKKLGQAVADAAAPVDLQSKKKEQNKLFWAMFLMMMASTFVMSLIAFIFWISFVRSLPL